MNEIPSSSRRSIKSTTRSGEKRDKNESNRSDSSKSLRKVVDQADYFSTSRSHIGGGGNLFISKSISNKADMVNKISSEYFDVNAIGLIQNNIKSTNPFDIEK